MRTHNKEILIAFLLLNLLSVLAVNFAVLVAIMDEWWSIGPYNHGLLGLALAVFVVWTKKQIFVFTQGNFLTQLVLIITCLLLLFANLASIGQLQVLSLFLVIVALLLCFYGGQAIRQLSLPLIMLILILPIWNVLQIPLRDMATWLSFHSVDLLGFEIIRQGYTLRTPGGNFIVEQACSGLGFFLASALYAVFVAQINHLSGRSSLLFCAFSIAVALLANWIRITVIIIVGSQTMMQHFIVQDHLTFGWLVFAACFIPVVIIGHVYFGEQIALPSSLQKNSRQTPKMSTRYLATTSTIILFLVIASVLIPARFDPNYKLILPSIPHYTQLTLNNNSSLNWHPVSQGASSEEFSYFLKDKDLLQVYLANYARQQQGKEMIFVENSLFDKNRWFNVQQQIVPLNSPYLNQVNLITLDRNPLQTRLIAYWYLVDGHFINDKKSAKLYEVQATLKGQPGATLIAIAFDFQNSEKQHAHKIISDFAEAFSRQPINTKKSL